MKHVILYHAGCADGKFAAVLLQRCLNSQPENHVVPLEYHYAKSTEGVALKAKSDLLAITATFSKGDPDTTIEPRSIRVWFVDICPDFELIELIASSDKFDEHISIIDHHLDKIAELQAKLLENGGTNYGKDLMFRPPLNNLITYKSSHVVIRQPLKDFNLSGAGLVYDLFSNYELTGDHCSDESKESDDLLPMSNFYEIRQHPTKGEPKLKYLVECASAYDIWQLDRPKEWDIGLGFRAWLEQTENSMVALYDALNSDYALDQVIEQSKLLVKGEYARARDFIENAVYEYPVDHPDFPAPNGLSVYIGSGTNFNEDLVNLCLVRDNPGKHLMGIFHHIGKKPDIRVSLRGSPDVIVNQVARQKGGGGHPSASACTITRTHGGDTNEAIVLAFIDSDLYLTVARK